MKWERFKKIVKMQRKMQNWLIDKEQGGCNAVMFSIGVMDEESNDWIDFPPHRIDLRTGYVHATNCNGKFKKYNIKKLLKDAEER